jgi:hypothetical protein
MHPDPAGLAAVDPSNPQSWNRYAYASNSPMNYIDPSGLSDCVPGEWRDCGDNFSWADFWGGDAQATRAMFFGNPQLPDGVLLPQGFGNVSGIWDEQLPPLVGLPYDPRLIIQDWHRNDNGSPVGDYSGEPLCLTSPWLPACAWVYWNPYTLAWENDVPLPPGVGEMLGSAGRMGDAGVKAAMVVTAPQYILMGGVVGAEALGPEGPIFGTGEGGSGAGLNAGDKLRAGWSYLRSTGGHRFRIAGKWLGRGHINLWPPSWWFGPPPGT